MAPAHGSRHRIVALVVALALALVGTACAGESRSAGSGFTIGAVDLTATTTTTTTAPPPPSFVTQVATATVPQLEVYTTRPGTLPDPSSSMVGGTGPGQRPAIPRVGFNSAGATRTDFGFTFDNPTYFKKPLALVVTIDDGDWLKVLLPARPNGQEGWVRASDVVRSTHRFHALLDLSERVLAVWEGDEPVLGTKVVVGRDATATPTGRFYIAQVLTAADAGLSPGGAYGPNILATNGYSETLDLFDNGLPVIAFHGTNQPGLIGTAASNGCIRLPNDVIVQLADTLPAGTPVDIVE